MDYDAIVIGSGFGGAVTSCRLAEAGYRVLILERGREWTFKEKEAAQQLPGKPTSYPRLGDDPEVWVWDHECPERLNGWVDLRVFPTMTVAQGAGVGGGSLIYANISVKAKESAFDSGWPPSITYQGLQPYYEQVGTMLGVQPLPKNQWNGRTRLMKDAATALGYGDRFERLELAVRFDNKLTLDLANAPSRPPVGTVFPTNQHGIEQGTCYHCGTCDIGCDVNARNTLDTNYLARARKHGAVIKPLHLVTGIEPSEGGYRVSFDDLHAQQRMPGSHTARLVVLAAGSLGSTELLLVCRDLLHTLPGLSPFLGKNWSSNGDFLTPAFYSERDVSPSTGPTITCAINFHDGVEGGQRFWIQDGGFPDLLAKYVESVGASSFKHLKSWVLLDALRVMLKDNPTHQVMPWFAQGVDAGDGVLRLKRPWWFFGKRKLHLDWDVGNSPVFDTIVDMHNRLSAATGGKPHVPVSWSLARNLITPHPLGGCNMGGDKVTGVVDEFGEVFGYQNLFVADGAILPRPIGVNPSRTIAALAERIAEFIVAEKR